MGQNAGEAKFPLSTSIEKGEGRERRFPSNVAGLGTSSVPRRTSTNKHAEPKGQIRFSARFQSCAPESERKQEGSQREEGEEGEKGEGHARLGPNQMGNGPTPHPKLTHHFL